MKNVIDLLFRQKDVVRYVMLDKAKIIVAGEMPNIFWIAGNKIVDRNNAMSFRQQPIDQM